MSATVVCVSDQQRAGIETMLRRLRIADRVRTCTIYNPIDDGLAPDGSPVDERKLVFFSSPNKGLRFTLDVFGELRRRMPDLRLVVGNPGYKIRKTTPMPGVEYLGPQPQHRIHQEVRTALCTFVPNFVLPETFGLVFAESNALGTPVLTHDCGAAAEVIGDPRQLLPVTFAHRAYEGILGKLSPRYRALPARLASRAGLFDRYVERIQAWRAGARPKTGPDPRYRLATVAKQWRALLSE
jgi:glycosyltransferase involved in cell wall biosynthesis